MKKLLIAILVLAAVYAVGAAVFAVANGQAEGKVLNAENQLLVDGDMEKSGTSDWTVGQSATLTKESGGAEDGDYIMRVAYGGATNPRAYQSSILTPGKTYRATGWARSDGTQLAEVRHSSPLESAWTSTNSTSWQYFDVIFSPSVSGAFFLQNSGNAGYVEFDDVVVTKYLGKQTNAESQLLADGDMEADGVTSWALSCGGTGGSRTKVAGAAEDGNQIIRVARSGDMAYCYARQAILTLGKTYRVTGWARSDELVAPRVLMGNGLAEGSYWVGTTSTGWQRVDFIGQPSNSTSLYLGTGGLLDGSYLDFDDITVTEYTGPAVDNEKQLLADGDMEAGDTSDWTAGGGATLSKESGAAEDGDRILRVTRVGADGRALQTILSAGTRYRVTGWTRSDGSGIPTVKEPGVSASWTGTASTDWQYFDVIFTAQTTQIFLSKSTSDGNYVEFDDVALTEL